MPLLLTTIIQLLWFLLPALTANTAPVIAARYQWLTALDRPLDGKKMWWGRRILGESKTVRGLVVGILTGLVVGIIQYFLQSLVLFADLVIVPLPSLGFAAGWGALLGFGALAGDALKSFAKRQFDIPPGNSWKPWDQIDVALGVVAVTWWYVPYTVVDVMMMCVVVGVIMYAVSWIGVRLRIKQSV